MWSCAGPYFMARFWCWALFPVRHGSWPDRNGAYSESCSRSPPTMATLSWCFEGWWWELFSVSQVPGTDKNEAYLGCCSWRPPTMALLARCFEDWCRALYSVSCVLGFDGNEAYSESFSWPPPTMAPLTSFPSTYSVCRANNLSVSRPTLAATIASYSPLSEQLEPLALLII
jgi:hypothetical protein